MEEYIMYFWAYIYNYRWTVGSCPLCACMVKFEVLEKIYVCVFIHVFVCVFVCLRVCDLQYH